MRDETESSKEFFLAAQVAHEPKLDPGFLAQTAQLYPVEYSAEP